jgi:hypothetical protein
VGVCAFSGSLRGLKLVRQRGVIASHPKRVTPAVSLLVSNGVSCQNTTFNCLFLRS